MGRPVKIEGGERTMASFTLAIATKERIKKITSNQSEFIREAVEEKLDKEEKKAP